jgi:membrane protease YdiL (CAAX protease family)
MHPAIVSAIEAIKTTKKQLIAQIVIVFIIPILLIHSGYLPISARAPTLVVLISILVFILFKEQWTWSMLGVQRHVNRRFLMAYVIFTALGILFIIQFGEGMGHEGMVQWWRHAHFLYAFFVVSLFQEVAYRGYLIPALGKFLRSPIQIVLSNAVLFTYLHTIFPNPLLALPLAFVGGVAFAVMYLKYPSLPLVIASHAVLNFVAVLYGFFVVPGITY